ncbi:MAG TPA: lipopolysaccharide kinase InaA family protein [Gemmatimonadaceae bacterium]|nr:lipopolysaccharide kinase InaA family protein [Gemmatimonadaceae bacterium]
MRLDVPVPRGYTRLDEPGAMIVARGDVAAAIGAAYRAAPSGSRTLHAFAASVPGARHFHGRAPAYAVALPASDLRIVVRHNRHGGALRSITGDLFLGATRAPMELETALTLHDLLIPTPAVLAYAVYPAGSLLSRSDVVTEEVPDSTDFGALLLSTEPESDDRRKGWNATRRLLKRLAAAGVRHHDLNVKNVLLRRTADDLFAGYILDVDRVEFDCARRDAYAGNRARLRRSVEKWRDTRGARITAAEIDALRHTVTSMP